MTVVFREDFPGSSLDGSKWTLDSGSVSVVSGVAAFTNASFHSISTFPHGHFMSFSIVQNVAGGFGWQAGFKDISSAARIDTGNVVNFTLGTVPWSSSAIGLSIAAHSTGNGTTLDTMPDNRFGTFGLYTYDVHGGVALGLLQLVGAIWIPVSIAVDALTPTYSYSVFFQSFSGNTLALDWIQVEDTVPIFSSGSSPTYYVPGITGNTGPQSTNFAPPGTR